DFVLWKPKKEGEPYWESPWGDGRPGWHIECSVMSKRYLGDSIDIHAGGEDLIFPHHENEIAQSECANGVPFANYWLHNAFLNIDGVKMSKSLGNFFTVRDITAQYDPAILRYFMLSAHYRSPLNFSREIMESSKNSLERIINAVDRLADTEKSGADGELTARENEKLEEMKQFRKQFEDAMDDDLNTADAIAAVFNLVKFANTEVVGKAQAADETEVSTKAFAAAVKKEILDLTDILGLKVVRAKEADLDAEVEAKIEERQAARKAKDFARADAIRDELLAMGIELKDTREGVKWKRV
ncbi:MAG: cysteine--tRNA ligase, partial [Eubacterium sp.]|nr:cysteine--tRNA ligase [Eubacterium sp.]